MPSNRRREGDSGDAGDEESAGSDSALSGGGGEPKPRRKMTPEEREQYPSAGIVRPGPNDVLCGRGGGTNNHSGNVRFRKLVNEHKMRYLAATKVEKPKVAREVVKIWRGMDPPGRFLARSGEGADGDKGGGVKAKDKDEGVVWHDVGDKKAREKASQCLRERTPEVMTFVKKLQAQQQVSLAPKDDQDVPVGDAAFIALADPALSAQFAAAHQRHAHPHAHAHVHALSSDAQAQAQVQAQAQAQAQAYAFAQQRPGQHHAGSGISSQFLVAPGSGGSSVRHQYHQGQGQGQGQGGWAFGQDDFATSGFTQFAANPFHQQQQQQGHHTQAHPQAQWTQQQQQAMAMHHAANMHRQNGHHADTQHAEGGDNDELTLEEYQRSLEEYISRECGLTPQDAARAVDPDEARREAMEEVRGTSWIKSFHSIDTQSLSMDMASVTSQSIRNMAMAELAGAGGPGGVMRDPQEADEDDDDDDDYDEDEVDDDVILEEESGMFSSSRASRTQRTTAEFSSSTVKTSHLDPIPAGPELDHHDDHDHHGNHHLPPSSATAAAAAANRSGRSLRSRGTSKKSRHAEPSSTTSNLSMFTDSTGLSSLGTGVSAGGGVSGNKSAGGGDRSDKMSAARTLKSDISMLSELTDLSGTVSNMSIGR